MLVSTNNNIVIRLITNGIDTVIPNTETIAAEYSPGNLRLLRSRK